MRVEICHPECEMRDVAKTSTRVEIVTREKFDNLGYQATARDAFLPLKDEC